ncbi:unnamed protein product [Heterobilharzia americana]|nr:unnamed protein product [Heterobilharzia americana]
MKFRQKHWKQTHRQQWTRSPHYYRKFPTKEGRKEGKVPADRFEEGLPCQNSKEWQHKSLHELTRIHAPPLSTPSKLNIMPDHPGETKTCTGFKTMTGTGWLTAFRKNKSCVDQIATLRYTSSQNRA